MSRAEKTATFTTMGRASPAAALRDVVARTLLPPVTAGKTICLAVSGGADSMVLLDAAHAVLPPSHLLVATFDHGSGPWAAEAVRFVAQHCAERGVACVVGHAIPPASRPTEAGWRQARWAFLRETAQQANAVIATAHTEDDQIETVFMRVLRAAGPRGLAGLYAPSPVLRPLLHTRRADIEAYAREHDITFVTDPSNASRRHLRNRVRHDLLPAFLAHDPQFSAWLLTLSRRAAEWRESAEDVANLFEVMPDATQSWHIPRKQFSGLDLAELHVVWPAVLGRVGIVLDWRGTRRLAAFTIEGRSGQSIQLSGRVEVIMRREALFFRGA